jgi:prolyl-tRNA synthetase
LGDKIQNDLRTHNLTVKVDKRETHKPGFKFAEYELKGVPVRIAIGPRDISNNTVELARRDTREKITVHLNDLSLKIIHLLEQIQDNLFQKAISFRESMTFSADTMDEFLKILDQTGGFVAAHWDRTTATENKIKDLTKATIRCIPFDMREEKGKCILTGEASPGRVIFARAY